MSAVGIRRDSAGTTCESEGQISRDEDFNDTSARSGPRPTHQDGGSSGSGSDVRGHGLQYR